MKIVLTISDYGAVANVGGDVEKRSYVINIPDDELDDDLKNQFNPELNTRKWFSISLSMLEEPT